MERKFQTSHAQVLQNVVEVGFNACCVKYENCLLLKKANIEAHIYEIFSEFRFSSVLSSSVRSERRFKGYSMIH